MERYASFMLQLEFSLKYKISLQEGQAEFRQKRCLERYCCLVLHFELFCKYKRCIKEREGVCTQN